MPDSAGIVVRACVQLLEAKEVLSKRGVYVSLSAQFVEIYDEKVREPECICLCVCVCLLSLFFCFYPTI